MAKEISAPTAHTATMREHIGSYRLLEEVAIGEPGTAFVAESPDSHRPVVVKWMGHVEHFQDKAQVLTCLKHEHLVSVIESLQEDGECYLVLEHLKGEALQQRLKRENRLSLKEAMRVARETASSLTY